MLETIMPALWMCFTAYATWYFTLAKHYAPITLNDARILWKIHQHNAHCNAKGWREIRRRNKIVGFECECGYKHIQKRPLMAGMPTPETRTDASVLEKLHTTYKST